MSDREQQLSEIVERLKSYEPESIILFGSHARGEAHHESDTDIVVVKRTNQHRTERLDAVLKLIYPGTRVGMWPKGGVDVLVYTPEEIRKRVDLGDFFVKRILREGRVLYGQKPLDTR